MTELFNRWFVLQMRNSRIFSNIRYSIQQCSPYHQMSLKKINLNYGSTVLKYFFLDRGGKIDENNDR